MYQMIDSTGFPSAWSWVYNLDDRTPRGSHEALLSMLQAIPDEPLLLYFEAADPDYPKDDKGWCPDCKLNSKALHDFVLTEEFQNRPVRLWRVIASWDREDWKDPAGVPNMENDFRDPTKPWRLPGLPCAQLVVYTAGQAPRIVDGVLNPDSQGLDYLRRRGASGIPLPTERILC